MSQRGFIVLLALIGLSSHAGASDLTLPLTAPIEGSSAAKLVIEQHQWVMSHRVAKKTSEEQSRPGCVASSSGSVWLLVSARPSVCKLPAGKNLLVSVSGILATGDEIPGVPTCKILQGQIKAIYETVQKTVAKIDGVEIENVIDNRVRITNCFSLPNVVKKGNINYPVIAVSDGYWLLLKPLSEGKHTVTINARAEGKPDVPTEEYEIIVE